MNFCLIIFCKFIAYFSKVFNLGNGSTWPGHIALTVNKNFIKASTKHSPAKIILIAGTNGKTTTATMIRAILEENKHSVFQNNSGANLLNGIASSLIFHANIFGKVQKEYAVFEIDENALPLVLKEITPHAIILLNLFRDQLDRYGEIDTIAKKWKQALHTVSPSTKIFLNADDPQIAYLGAKNIFPLHYFGLEEQTQKKTLQHAADSIYCPNCHTKLTYKKIYYSHLGDWSCPKCKLKRPKPFVGTQYIVPLEGTYNKYNALAAVLFAKGEGISDSVIERALKKVKPAFGRQEIVEIQGKKVQIFLSKNPTSFNQSLATIKKLGCKTILFVLNDKIPDGRDVSWIWDIDIEEYIADFDHIIVSGDRALDMILRAEYSIENQKLKCNIVEKLEQAIQEGLALMKEDETLYILPTYSAMLEVRKILTGKKIL